MRSKFCLAFLPDGTPPAKLRVLDYEKFPEAKELKSLNRTQPLGKNRLQDEPMKGTVMGERQTEFSRAWGSRLKQAAGPGISLTEQQKLGAEAQTAGEMAAEQKETPDDAAGTRRAALPW
ncbi:hypothetical protein [Desulfofundulus salinus]|uniref:Uncharacterized protein n=1 Tax=Desulfofundulus salinus TaxID=2419843 RepID=A0A494WRB6_9FIRM|nr:hypothetical protein [Desulfofundulus salinum]RKO65749.1 hypothetical protein D7024_01375 [Desulfofundulus salinum]